MNRMAAQLAVIFCVETYELVHDVTLSRSHR